MRLNKKGFTLVEIIIVVAIIVLLAAIAIPNLLRARLNANEASAIAALKTLSSAMETYFVSQRKYPSDLTYLVGATPPYIDSVLGSGNKSGYWFNLSGGGNTYNVTATPLSPNVSGIRTFFLDPSGVIRVGTDDTGTPIS